MGTSTPIMTTRSIFHMLFLLCAGAMNAQDSLFYSNGKVIVGRVEEIGIDLVRYRTGSDDAPVLVVAEKKDLSRIKLEAGQEFLIGPEHEDTEGAKAFLDRRHQLTFDFLAPALNHAVVGYEQTIGERMSIVAKVGYIGIGNYQRNGIGQDYAGTLAKLGVNFFLPRSAKRAATIRDRHPLAGWYLRPELSASNWRREDGYVYNPYPYTVLSRSEFSSVSLNMIIGRKLVLGDRLTFDVFGGLGYGIQWIDGTSTYTNGRHSRYRQDYSYSHAFLGNYSLLTCTGGMMLGYLF